MSMLGMSIVPTTPSGSPISASSSPENANGSLIWSPRPLANLLVVALEGLVGGIALLGAKLVGRIRVRARSSVGDHLATQAPRRSGPRCSCSITEETLGISSSAPPRTRRTSAATDRPHPAAATPSAPGRVGRTPVRGGLAMASPPFARDGPRAARDERPRPPLPHRPGEKDRCRQKCLPACAEAPISPRRRRARPGRNRIREPEPRPAMASPTSVNSSSGTSGEAAPSAACSRFGLSPRRRKLAALGVHEQPVRVHAVRRAGHERHQVLAVLHHQAFRLLRAAPSPCRSLR